jgi:hypothetical protein
MTLGLIADQFGLFAAIATLASAAVVCGLALATAVRVVPA